MTMEYSMHMKKELSVSGLVSEGQQKAAILSSNTNLYNTLLSTVKMTLSMTAKLTLFLLC